MTASPGRAILDDVEQRLGSLALAGAVEDGSGPGGGEKARAETRWRRIEALAVRLGVEPLADDDYDGVAVYDPEGGAGYAVDSLVNALLDRIEAAERLLAEKHPGSHAVAGHDVRSR
jgi:hypothetical protein